MKTAFPFLPPIHLCVYMWPGLRVGREEKRVLYDLETLCPQHRPEPLLLKDIIKELTGIEGLNNWLPMAISATQTCEQRLFKYELLYLNNRIKSKVLRLKSKAEGQSFSLLSSPTDMQSHFFSIPKPHRALSLSTKRKTLSLFVCSG